MTGSGRGAVVGIVVAAAICAGVMAAWMHRELDRVLSTPLPIAETIVVDVPRGTTIEDITVELTARGALERPVLLVWHARTSGKANEIKAGEYAVVPGTTPMGLLDQLVAGRVLQHALTIVEGWTFDEIMSAVRSSEHLVQTLRDPEPLAVMERIGEPGVHPEGRFFADTYHFPRGTTDVEFLHRAREAMRDHLAREWPLRDAELPLDTPVEALILASIVEKETGLGSERPRIAGVFVARLRRGMRLESDPTVIYGLGDSFDGNLTRRDLRRDTPYNTYTRRGLPPTPIATPGPAAIDAVLHPVVDGSLYFVARGDGSHEFSRTYAEHRRAVARYQLRRRRPSNAAGRQGG